MKSLNKIIRQVLREETFNDLFNEKNKWVTLGNKDKEILKYNLYSLVSGAYDTRFKGGHPRITNPDDITNDPDLVFWAASDIDDDPMADVVVFGRTSSGGFKLSGIGHENTRLTKDAVMDYSAKILKQKGFWIEVSGAPAKILLEKGVPMVKNPKIVEKILGNKIDKWLGGWYFRDVGGGNVLQKCILGKPSI